MKLLLIDIGNTNTKIKVTGDSEVYSVQTSDKYTKEILSLLLPEQIKVEVDDVVISSVVPKALLPIKKYIQEEFKKEPIIIDPQTMKSHVNYPENVKSVFGADMFASMNAVASFEKTFLSIDCGTACTFNLVIDNNFIGTSIAPGLSTSHRALMSSASLIKYVSLNDESIKLLSTNTEDCVRGGTILGWSFMIDGFISEIKKEYKLDNLKVYLTGGVAHLLSPHIKNEITLEKDLLFRGLEELYKLNKEN